MVRMIHTKKQLKHSVRSRSNVMNFKRNATAWKQMAQALKPSVKWMSVYRMLMTRFPNRKRYNAKLNVRWIMQEQCWTTVLWMQITSQMLQWIKTVRKKKFTVQTKLLKTPESMVNCQKKMRKCYNVKLNRTQVSLKVLNKTVRQRLIRLSLKKTLTTTSPITTDRYSMKMMSAMQKPLMTQRLITTQMQSMTLNRWNQTEKRSASRQVSLQMHNKTLQISNRHSLV